ncbi:MAG: hypothetical protein AAGI03_02015 [Pseudomonadota bacterium]
MMDEFDLFGDPVRLPNGRRGRPAHVATQENRNKVMILLAMGWANDRIAHALRCSLPTLKKHYFSELKTRDIARDRLLACRFMQTFREAESGNVGAQRLFDQMIEKNDARLAADALATDSVGQRALERAERTGKKAAQRREAEQVVEESSGDWAGDLTPGWAQ